jgi:restriction system protein
MAVPDFQSLLLPLLKFAGDGQEHSSSEAAEALAREFGLTDEDKAELVAPGKPTKLRNRVAWAWVFLRRGGLLEGAGYGRFRISQRGREVLQEGPRTLNVKFLMRFPEFKLLGSPSQQEREPESNQTPLESIESSYQLLRRNLAADLLERIKGCSPAFFEKLVVDLPVAMGYGGSRTDAGQAVGRGGDGGIDGIIKEDKLGLDAVYVQAKRWDATVGRPVVQAFAGSLEGQRARKGVLITTSDFSKEPKTTSTGSKGGLC